MTRFLPPVIAVALLIASGTAYGLRSHRWVRSNQVEQSMARLEALPMHFGPWQGRADTIDARSLAQAGIDGYLMRHYRHASTGEEVAVMLVTGLPGPISSHPPDICYRSAGYVPIKAPERYTVAGLDTAEFRLGQFAKPDAITVEGLRILWAWGAGGAWAAPEEPRLKYALERSLYKIYIISDLSSGYDDVAEESGSRDVGDEFASDFLGTIQQILFPPA